MILPHEQPEESGICATIESRIEEIWNQSRSLRLKQHFRAAAPEIGPVTRDIIAASLHRWVRSWANVVQELCDFVASQQAHAHLNPKAGLKCLNEEPTEIYAVLSAYESTNVDGINRVERAMRDLPDPMGCIDPNEPALCAEEPIPSQLKPKVRESNDN